MNAECLRQLRRVIEAAPDDRLCMSDFSTQTPCGTAYCAAGWAAVDPWFRENTKIGKAFVRFDDGSLESEDLVWPVLQETFGLSEQDANALFAGDATGFLGRNVSKSEVIANIDRILAGRPAGVYAAIRDDDYVYDGF